MRKLCIEILISSSESKFYLKRDYTFLCNGKMHLFLEGSSCDMTIAANVFKVACSCCGRITRIGEGAVAKRL